MSASDINDWPGHPDADPDCECCLGDGLQADGETPCPCIDARKGYRAAQTIAPAPQPEAATPTAQEAVACLHGYCDAENCPACSQDQEVAQPTEDELDEAWKSGFNAGFGEAKLTAHPPQLSEIIAAVERAFDEIRELNMSGRDENGHRWANSDLIDQTVTEGLVALRALKGDDANG